jgi:hypothetical protein
MVVTLCQPTCGSAGYYNGLQKRTRADVTIQYGVLEGRACCACPEACPPLLVGNVLLLGYFSLPADAPIFSCSLEDPTYKHAATAAAFRQHWLLDASCLISGVIGSLTPTQRF